MYVKIFYCLTEDKQFKYFAWYGRGLGRHYAIQSRITLGRLEAYCTGDRARQARDYLERAARSFRSVSLEAEQILK